MVEIGDNHRIDCQWCPAFTYVLPVACDQPLPEGEVDSYLGHIGQISELIVVDGSAEDVFAEHHKRWGCFATHVRPQRPTLNRKVGGVLTGMALASHDRVVLADDDVRYQDHNLSRLVQLLDEAAVVRPQNYFEPLPWHAVWDSGRALFNRLLDGDWPGTLGIRRSVVLRAGGYSGDVLFENFELCCVVKAAGGRELVASDLFVRRLPPTTAHFFRQRIRQAYDELARPGRFVCFLVPLPLVTFLAVASRWRLLVRMLAAAATVSMVAAEAGRRRQGGRAYFPFRCSLAAPLWVAERSICSWAAAYAIIRGGVSYRGGRLSRAALSPAERRARVRFAMSR